MNEAEISEVTGIDPLVREKFLTEKTPVTRIPSTAQNRAVPDRLDSLALPLAERGRMPFTKEKFIIKENPALVYWERETRMFLRQLSPNHAHRVSAAMVFEWVTGITVKDYLADGGNTTDLKNINKILTSYFGKSYQTYICGRKVPRAYKVREGYYIKRHRPISLELYAEYVEGVLPA